MTTTALIREHISGLPAEALFTTRDFLCYGLRSTIDNALYAMVKAGDIIRVARGVFHKKERSTPVTVEEAALTKAVSFGRKIISHAGKILSKLGFHAASEFENHFTIDGRTSSFRFGSEVIHFVGTNRRKFALGDSPSGKALRVLCFLGKERLTADLIDLVTAKLNSEERAEVGSLCASVPSWLSDIFSAWYQKRVRTGMQISIMEESDSSPYTRRNEISRPWSVSEDLNTPGIENASSAKEIKNATPQFPTHKIPALAQINPLLLLDSVLNETIPQNSSLYCFLQ